MVGDVLDAPLDVLALHRPLLERTEKPVAQLVLIERLPAIVALYDVRHHELGRLECRKALAARQALAAPTHLTAFAREPRIDDLGILEIAERTVHFQYLDTASP